MNFVKSIKNPGFIRKSILIWAIFITYEITFNYFYSNKIAPLPDYINGYLVNILIFYINAHYVFPRVHKKPIYLIILCLLTELAGYILLKYTLTTCFLNWGFSEVDPFAKPMAYLSQVIWRFIYFMGLSTGYWFALNTILKEKEISNLEKNKLIDQLHTQKLEKELVNTEIAYLKSQINPHFLFNTLNFLYNSAQQISEHIARPILLLSEIMHYAIAETTKSGKVDLSDEIEQIHSFIELNQLRFDQALQLTFEITGNSSHLKILPLLLLTPVENIFKYAHLKDNSYPAVIKLDIQENHLYFMIKNKKSKGKRHNVSSRIGIKNLKLRLDAYYLNRYHLEIDDREDDYQFQLHLTL